MIAGEPMIIVQNQVKYLQDEQTVCIARGVMCIISHIRSKVHETRGHCGLLVSRHIGYLLQCLQQWDVHLDDVLEHIEHAGQGCFLC